jgi:hypothetical protein
MVETSPCESPTYMRTKPMIERYVTKLRYAAAVTGSLLLLSLASRSNLSESVIFYGEDDYVEIDQISKLSDTKVDWLTIAKSVAIVINDPGKDGLDLSKAQTMRQRYKDLNLDPKYKYGDQVSVAKLTAFLVGPDKIMTAGHAGFRDLERSAFLFDFEWDSTNKCLRKTSYLESEIFHCEEVLLYCHDELGDFAICRLDKPVPGRKALKLEVVKNAGAINLKHAKMISAPDGLPLKLTNDGQIFGTRRSQRAPDLVLTSFFFHSLDNSGGSSGAPIFDAKTGQVIGIQSGGDDNFMDKDGVAFATRGDFEQSNLGRPLTGEWGSLIPPQALELVGQK